MFNAALIVFRETLEAALVIGIIAAATRLVARRWLWIGGGVAAGVVGALALASIAQRLGQLADGMGHEFFNAAVLSVAILMLAGHSVWMAGHGRQLAGEARSMGARVQSGDLALSALSVAVALTVLREGGETVLFLYGVVASAQTGAAAMLWGGMAGLVAGAMVGALTYRGLMGIPMARLFTVTSWLMLAVVAGMAAQLAQLLIQADVLPPLVQPLWDTSRVLDPDSALGVLLHALIGYDAQPSATEVGFAVAVFAAVLIASRLARPARTPA